MGWCWGRGEAGSCCLRSHSSPAPEAAVDFLLGGAGRGESSAAAGEDRGD